MISLAQLLEFLVSFLFSTFNDQIDHNEKIGLLESH